MRFIKGCLPCVSHSLAYWTSLMHACLGTANLQHNASSMSHLHPSASISLLCALTALHFCKGGARVPGLEYPR
jgi:hypothetical protein